MHNSVKSKPINLTIIFYSLSLAACGGGNKNNTPPTPEPDPTAFATINSETELSSDVIQNTLPNGEEVATYYKSESFIVNGGPYDAASLYLPMPDEEGVGAIYYGSNPTYFQSFGTLVSDEDVQSYASQNTEFMDNKYPNAPRGNITLSNVEYAYTYGEIGYLPHVLGGFDGIIHISNDGEVFQASFADDRIRLGGSIDGTEITGASSFDFSSDETIHGDMSGNIYDTTQTNSPANHAVGIFAGTNSDDRSYSGAFNYR